MNEIVLYTRLISNESYKFKTVVKNLMKVSTSRFYRI